MPITHKKRNSKEHKVHYFYFTSNALIESCPIPKKYIQQSKDSKNNTLIVLAHASMKLSEYLKKSNIVHMDYNHVEIMIHCIGKQLQLLENKDIGIPVFHLDDFTVFFIKKPKVKETKYRSDSESTDSDTDSTDSTASDTDSDTDSTDSTDDNIIHNNNYNVYFAITNDDKLSTFKDAENYDNTVNAETENNDQFLVINAPLHIDFASYQKNKSFISPEFADFKKAKSIPYDIHFKSGYYSFGLLCIYCMLTKTVVSFNKSDNQTVDIDSEIKDCLFDNQDQSKTTSTIENLSKTSFITFLRMIKNTKIYWFLIRALKINPQKRQYICV